MGRKVDANVVQSLFHSIQLNINNPHFLIMQGRITKFLSAKPHEILSMIEEATGTRLYEIKKNIAMKILDKKQMKMNAIEELLKMYILSGLNKLHEEQTAYCRWKEVNHDIECLKRVIIVLELKNQENFLNHIEKEIKLGKNQIEKINLFKKKLIATMNKNIINREKIEKDKEKNKFREYKEIMVKITALFKKITKDLSHLNHVLIRLK